jgi:hypothetical protein
MGVAEMGALKAILDYLWAVIKSIGHEHRYTDKNGEHPFCVVCGAYKA